MLPRHCSGCFNACHYPHFSSSIIAVFSVQTARHPGRRAARYGLHRLSHARVAQIIHLPNASVPTGRPREPCPGDTSDTGTRQRAHRVSRLLRLLGARHLAPARPGSA